MSRRHKVHDVFGLVVSPSLGAAALAFGFALEGGWKIHSIATAALVIALLIAFVAALERDSPRTVLPQRLTMLVGWTWIALLGLSLMSP